jgi:hypothetical protein
VDVSVNLTAPSSAGHYRGFWKFQNPNGTRFGIGASFTSAWWVDIQVSGPTATPGTPTVTSTPPSPTATSTPTATTTPDTSGWITFQNAKYGFHFKVPSGSVVESNTDNAGKVQLPFTSGTDLNGKWIEVSIVEGANPCKAPGSNPQGTSSNVTYNNIQFLKEVWSEGAAGTLYDLTAFSTQKQPNNACITLKFVLRHVDTGALPTPTPPPYNQAAETAVFPVIMGTYGNQ